MPRIRITPNRTYSPGHIGSLLAQVAPGPMVLEKDGTVIVKMTDSQLEDFYRRGGAAHKVDILPESDPPSAMAGTVPAARPDTALDIVPDAEDVTLSLPEIVEPNSAAPREYVNNRRIAGKTDSEIVQELIEGGWRESQAIDLVMNNPGPESPAAA